MVLWVFDGDMVGKWTNEPCNGVDEVVNHFWVLTHAQASIDGTRDSTPQSRDVIKEYHFYVSDDREHDTLFVQH